jgi:hypothetical protein
MVRSPADGASSKEVVHNERRRLVMNDTIFQVGQYVFCAVGGLVVAGASVKLLDLVYLIAIRVGGGI